MLAIPKVALWLGIVVQVALEVKRQDRRQSLVEEGTVIFPFTDGIVYRIPALLVLTPANDSNLADGDISGGSAPPTRQVVLAFAEERHGSASDSGNIDVVVRRSEDGGRTWSSLLTICDFAGDTCGNPSPVQDALGRVHLLLTGNAASSGEDSGSIVRTVWVVSSEDEGRTWTAPREITSSTKRPEWLWYATGPGHGIRLQHQPAESGLNGRLVVPCDHTVMLEEDWPVYSSHVIFSDDHGATWQMGGDVVEDFSDASSEATVAELQDGTLVLSARNYVDGAKATSPQLFTTSADGGMTWAREHAHPTLDLPDCEGSMIGVMRPSEQPLLNRSAGARLTDYLVLSHPTAASHPWDRRNLRLMVSADGGRSWPARNRVLVRRGPAAYSDLQMMPTGAFLVAYESADGPGIHTATVLPGIWL